MNEVFYQDFLNFIKKAGKAARQTPEMLKEYTERVDDFLERSRDVNRDHILLVDEIAKTLMVNGSYVEAAEALFNEARLYLGEKDLKRYYALLRKGFVNIFATVFIPEFYTELLNTVNELKGTEFYPFFLFLKGWVEQMHMHECELALRDYLKVKNLVYELNDEIVKIMGLPDKITFEGLLSINIADVLFKLTLKNRDEGEYYLAMADEILYDLRREFSKSGKIGITAELSWVQYFMVKGEPRRGKEILDAFVREYGKEDWFENYRAAILYLETLYFWSLGDYKSTVQHLKRAISEAIGSGNEIMTKETIDFALFLIETSGRNFSIYSKEGEEILNALLGILYSKDWYLGIDHSTKVAELSLKIAKEYTKMTKVELDDEKVYMSGLLHDIGKLYVPWYVLNKPGRLNNLEWLCIKYHPVYGREIMERIGLGEYGKYVEEHHERNDGTGYPYGKKNLVPLSQIIGVSDIFEAATSGNRQYREPKKEHEILKELKEMAGIKFDKVIITALVGALGKSIKESVL